MKTQSLVSVLLRPFLFSLLIPSAIFAQPKATPAPAPAKEITVAPALRQATDDAHAAWKQDVGAEFSSGLTYVQGVPTLMLVTTKGEDPDKVLRRKRAIVAACDFLLDDSTFAKAVICVVQIDPANPKGQTTSTIEVRRGNYKEAVQGAAKVADVKEGARKANETDSVLEGICAQIGVK